ncbi:hypothetical protein HYT52_04750 [Candidatus Woesearchaeota archaeon]|nr:hypothetical protein [Candidatus Woesearchaeota archaeon]
MTWTPDLERYTPRIDLGSTTPKKQVVLRDLPLGSTLQIGVSGGYLYTVERIGVGVKIWMDPTAGSYVGGPNELSTLRKSRLTRRPYLEEGVLRVGQPAEFPYFQYNTNSNTIDNNEETYLETIVKLLVSEPTER